MHQSFIDYFFRLVRLCRLRVAMLDEAIGLVEQDSNIKNDDVGHVESGADEADPARQKSEYLKQLAGVGF
ncbi:hypothetical protein QA640_44470 (plasmid) [Bradyrhizobium sp. CB82]|uniref:hypothetical protein n=1 Tax=Bradyrhizobium sp. CB82 TaxID=3039159 RepID=UPI0024B1C479|nr:hypothetical protein [Bradyrhizobium sp. CB82]WFU45868.1 hypothetical protein QA640_44470 [Bradyrhizobium sp. CB82]